MYMFMLVCTYKISIVYYCMLETLTSYVYVGRRFSSNYIKMRFLPQFQFEGNVCIISIYIYFYVFYNKIICLILIHTYPRP